MAFRLIVECDSAEEFERLQQQFAEFFSKRNRPAAAKARRGIFRATDLQALETLAASPSGLGTDELARALGIPNQSLPPVLNGWARRANARGMKLDDLMRRHPVTDSAGRPKTIYQLTERGREVLMGLLGVPSRPKEATDGE